MQHPIFAIGIPHGSEWLIILVLAVLFFGADKLPKLARGLGKSLGEFKKAKEDFEKEVHQAADDDAKVGDKGPHISGNLPQPLEPTPTATPAPTATPIATVTPAPTATPAGATSVDELTKKI
jgi:TatA/E family protein of Tat protein translocase